MSSVFSNNTITQAGLGLVAQAASTNQIIFVDALSASQVPQDPNSIASYDGISGIIDSSSATDNTARVVARFGNASEAQAVKAIAITARLNSQQDSEKVIFAYCYDNESQITFPPISSPKQHTRFAFNLTFEGQGEVAVVESGSASLSDLERFVSCHKAGDPASGEDQDILGAKHFVEQVRFTDWTYFEDRVFLCADLAPSQTDIFNIGIDVNNRIDNIYAKTLHVATIIGGDTIQSNWNVALGNNLVPESSTVTNWVSTVNLGVGESRFSGVYAKVLNGMSVEVRSESTTESGKVTLTYGSNALMVDKDIVPFSSGADIQACGQASKPWKELFVRDSIHITNGQNEFRIYEDDGGIVFSNKYTGGSSGEFFFEMPSSSGGTKPATIQAGTLYGSPMDTFKVKENINTHDLICSVGAIILAIPPARFISDNLRNRINVGETISIAANTWRVAEWTPGASGDSAPWSNGSHYEESLWGSNPDDYTYLPAGNYRACHSIAAGSGSYTNELGSPVMLQRLS